MPLSELEGDPRRATQFSGITCPRTLISDGSSGGFFSGTNRYGFPISGGGGVFLSVITHCSQHRLYTAWIADWTVSLSRDRDCVSRWLAGQYFGDKRIAVFGMALIVAGGLLTATGEYPVVLAGRLISGVGAVLLNVLLTKMTIDWFYRS